MAKKLTETLEQTIRDEFVHGVVGDDGARSYPTIDGLAKKHDVSRATLYRRSSDNDWQGQKNNYQSELQATIDADRMAKMAGEAKRLDDSCVQLSMGIINTVGRKLQRTLELERQNPTYEGMSSAELSHLSNATAQAQKIGKLALGQAQEISKVSANVDEPEAFRRAMERLDELAAARTEFGSEDSGALH